MKPVRSEIRDEMRHRAANNNDVTNDLWNFLATNFFRDKACYVDHIHPFPMGVIVELKK